MIYLICLGMSLIITDIELARQTWTNLFIDIVNLHFPLFKKKIRHNACPWITDYVVKLMKSMIRPRKLPSNPTVKACGMTINHYVTKSLIMLHEQKTDHYCGLIRENAGNSTKIWWYQPYSPQFD